MDNQTKTELEAAAFRRVVEHLGENTEVQNIDLMNLAGFCRNCLSRWTQDAAPEKGIEMDKMQAREMYYGMTMAEWKTQHQSEASPEKQDAFQVAFKENVGGKDA